MTPVPSDRWTDAPVRYPDPAVQVFDFRFERCRVSSAAVERIATGYRWAEGPVWFGDQRCLLWSDIPNDRMMRWDERTGLVSVFREPSGFSNGNTRDRVGRLVTCEHLTRRVTRTEYDGRLTVLADSSEGKLLNAPNDVVVSADGAVWFTDPGYGILSSYEGDPAELELPTRVYRVEPRGGSAPEVVIDSLERPNGLCFSPGEELLYVADSDSSSRKIHVYDMASGRPANGRVFVDISPGSPDGIRCDTDGNLWVAAAGGADCDGVHVFDPDGTRIGAILLPEKCANLCFGGRRNNRLFMAASQSVYSLFVHATGL